MSEVPAPEQGRPQIPGSHEEFQAVQGARGILAEVHEDAAGRLRTAEGPIARETVDELEDMAAQPTYNEVLNDPALARERRLQAPTQPTGEPTEAPGSSEEAREPSRPMSYQERKKTEDYLQRIEDGETPEGMELRRNWSDTAEEHEAKQRAHTEAVAAELRSDLARNASHREAVTARRKAEIHAAGVRQELDDYRAERNARADMFKKEMKKLELQNSPRYVELNRDRLEQEVQAKVDAAFAKDESETSTHEVSEPSASEVSNTDNQAEVPADRILTRSEGSVDERLAREDFARLRDAAVEAARNGNQDEAIALGGQMAEMISGLGLNDEQQEALSIAVDREIGIAANQTVEPGSQIEEGGEKKSLVQERKEAAEAAMAAVAEAEAEGRPQDEVNELIKKAHAAANRALRAFTLDFADRAHEAMQAGNQEEADRLADQARQELDEYINANPNLDAEHIEELRNNLQNRIDEGLNPVFMRVRPVGKRSGDVDPKGGQRGAGDGDSGDGARRRPDRPSNSNERTQTPERRRRLRRALAVGVVAVSGLLAGVGIGRATSTNELSGLSQPAREKVELDHMLDEAEDTEPGIQIGDAARDRIINDTDAFERMLNNQGDFNRMMVWREGQVQHRLHDLPEAERTSETEARIRAEVDKQLQDYFEDLDDNESV